MGKPPILTNDQQAALAALHRFAQSHERWHLLTGYAGTGKTTLLQRFIQELRANGDDRKIVLTAFSNKATKVLTQMARQWELNLDTMTCCQLLGLRPAIDEQTGQQVFQPDRRQGSQVPKYALVIVDECSMVTAELWQFLTEAIAPLLPPIQMLVVGDPAQLPPVNERESPCFREVTQRSDLTEVVRYGGAIGAIAADLRENLDRPTLPVFRSDIQADRTEGCFVLSRTAWEKNLLRAFQSEGYRQDPDRVRALAYTNRRVGELNRQIRAALYGQNAPRFIEGERLIALSPCLRGENIVLPTSAECEVTTIERGMDGLWPVWLLSVITEEGDRRILKVLDGEGQPRWQQRLSELAAAKRWLEFWQLKQRFHDVDYAYSLTVHKSQGSTFQDVFVDVPSLTQNRNPVERNQLCYVAFTRAAKRLFLYNG
ncbi:MAG: AAA family ATPase [Oscillatoriales cyanobacterium SM2_1_8]|nr:AAA family ATPase [Oscillatoriales cyanobacterium SM2_1_8]